MWEWERLRAGGQVWPIIVGSDSTLAQVAEAYGMDDPAVSGASSRPRRTPREILDAAAAIDFPADLRNWPGAYRPEDLRAPTGSWPDGEDGIGAGDTVQDGPLIDPDRQATILVLPTREGWEAPAHLRWGGWNACPPAEYHVAALRRWHESHGADLVAIDGDTITCRVACPPATREEALSLAREIYGYCSDIVDQGSGTRHLPPG